jgi:hypothetical protein
VKAPTSLVWARNSKKLKRQSVTDTFLGTLTVSLLLKSVKIELIVAFAAINLSVDVIKSREFTSEP